MNYKSLFCAVLCGLLVLTSIGSASAQFDNRPRKQQTVKRGSHSAKKKVKPRAYTGTPGQYPEGSDRLLTEKDIEHQTPWGLKVMENEIYARRGFIFNDPSLRKHFRKERWYRPRERRMRNIRLTETERANLDFLRHHQPRAKHWN